METFWSTSHAAGAQSSYLESLYELYLKDPSTVPDDWKIYFDSLPSVSDEQHEVSHQEIVERLKKKRSTLLSMPNLQTIFLILSKLKLFN